MPSDQPPAELPSNENSALETTSASSADAIQSRPDPTESEFPPTPKFPNLPAHVAPGGTLAQFWERAVEGDAKAQLSLGRVILPWKQI